MSPNTTDATYDCPYPHQEDAWCMLCGGTVCEHCTVHLSEGQKLCKMCHHSLVELNVPRTGEPHRDPDLEDTSLLNPNRAPVTFGFCALLGGIYLLTSYPTFTQANTLILDRFALDGAAIVQLHQAERLLTGNLLHADLTHLAFNVLALLIFGSLLEPRIQRGIYVLWLVLFMAGCDVLSLALLPKSSVGASGIAYGLQSAFLVLAAKHGLSEKQHSLWETLLSLRSYVFIMALIVLSDWMNASMLNVYGHLGGALAGALAALLYPLNRAATGKDWIWPGALLLMVLSMLGAWLVMAPV